MSAFGDPHRIDGPVPLPSRAVAGLRHSILSWYRAHGRMLRIRTTTDPWAVIGEDMARVRGWARLDAVEGQGVLVTIAGPISGQGVQDVVNELWSAGAEAIAIEDVRLVAGVVVAGEPGGLSVENQILIDPIELRAIGRGDTLTGSLTRVVGIVAQLAATDPEASVTVTPVERLQVPATDRDMAPAHGVPTL